MDDQPSLEAHSVKTLLNQSTSVSPAPDDRPDGRNTPRSLTEAEYAAEQIAQSRLVPPCSQIDCFFEEKYFSLLKSFETIFNLLQRSEETRSHMEELCYILMTSRTVSGFIRGVAPVLKGYLDLTEVRILFREDHPICTHRGWDPPEDSGIIPRELLESEPMEVESPFVIDNPSGKLSRALFKADRRMVSSAATASLHAHGRQMGLLCLASDDPARFAGGMDTESVALLAGIVSLGILNAWEHESRDQSALAGPMDGFCSETAFRQFLRHELARAWRFGRPFALAALTWHDPESSDALLMPHVFGLLRTHVRSSDVLCIGDNLTVWLLLPESGTREALNLVQRLCAASKDLSTGSIVLHAGITHFTTDAIGPADLVTACRLALQAAQQHDHDCAVVRSMVTGSTDSRKDRTSFLATDKTPPTAAP